MIDGLVVREMHRRCSYDLGQFEVAMDALKRYLRGHAVGKGTKTKEDRLVKVLCEREASSGFFSARFLGAINRDNIGHLNHTQIRKLKALLHTLPKKPFPVISVHDCFRVHPNNGNDLRKQYNQVLSDLAKSDMLSDLASQLLGVSFTYTKSDDFADEILTSDYALS